MEITIALAQIQSRQADPDYNLSLIKELCNREEITNPSQTIVVFPELATTGYLMYDDIFELIEPVPTGPICQELERIAKKNQCYLIAGLPEESISGIIYNTAVMFGPSGYLGKGRKILIPNYSIFNEKRYFRPATLIECVDTPLGRFGLQVCYDIFSPEITRAHAFMGAHTSICISAAPGVRKKYFETFIPSRAMENSINMVYVNQSAIQDELIFWGGSEIRTATGKQILKLKY
ncbi:MAG: carbon-nitrogen hydrolase family protein, partial [Candidatus Hodarchaeota archaeon]